MSLYVRKSIRRATWPGNRNLYRLDRSARLDRGCSALPCSYVHGAFTSKKDIAAVLEAVQRGNGCCLWGDHALERIEIVRYRPQNPWLFAFVDGKHDGEASKKEATAISSDLTQDARVVFYDLTSPEIEAVLKVLPEAGLETQLAKTMQVLGVAWLENLQPFEHSLDPNVPK